jgi:4-amino-4-deoxychorismate lyase
MSRFFETIKICDKVPCNLTRHNQRVNYTREALYGLKDPIMLEDWVIIPEDLCRGTYKCRVVFDPDPTEISFTPYKPPVFKTVRLVHDDTISYPFKLVDRQCIDYHKSPVQGDEVIFVKNDEVTDSSIANVVFSDGYGYFTPSHPLLPGTQRSKLLSEQRVNETIIRIGDIPKYRSFCFINAMMEFKDATWYPVSTFLRD